MPGGLVLEQRHGGVCELSGSHVLSRGGLQGGALWGDKLQALRAVPDGHGDHPGEEYNPLILMYFLEAMVGRGVTIDVTGIAHV